MGMTVRSFLQRLRIEKACSLMDESDLTLSQIAQQVGYTDSKHFADLFRRHKDMSPKAYKKSK